MENQEHSRSDLVLESSTDDDSQRSATDSSSQNRQSFLNLLNSSSSHSSNSEFSIDSIHTDSDSTMEDSDESIELNSLSTRAEISESSIDVSVATIVPVPIPHTPNVIPPPYHNPRFLGSLDYYYPPWIAPASTAIAPPPPALDSPTQDLHPTSRRYHQQTIDTIPWDTFQASCSTLKSNEHWGDDFLIKQDNTLRIYFQNINGFGLFQPDTDKPTDILKSMKLSKVDIVNVAQTSLNWQLLNTRNTMHELIRPQFPIYKLYTSRNKHRSTARVVPGGTAQIVVGDWTSRVVEKLHDPRSLGRWCGIKLRLKHNRYLYVITVYRVCAQSITQVGPETAFGQQAGMLAMEGITANPRKQLITDLTHHIKQLQNEYAEILIVMDANEDLTPASGSLTTLMRDCHLVDIFHHHHGTCPAFSTYDSGNKRLDYAIGSASLLPFVVRCGYLPFYMGVSSDHRGLFLDLSFELIDGLTKLESVPRRYLHSAFQKDVYKYKQYLVNEFKSHNIYQRAADLFHISDPIKAEDPTYINKLHSLDALIVAIQLKAEEECCRNRSQYDFSPEVHYTNIILNYWNTKRKEFTKHQDVTVVIQHIYNTPPEEYQQYIDRATGNAFGNWIKTKKRLRAIKAPLKQSRAQDKHNLIQNEATFTGHTVDQVSTRKTRVAQDRKLYQTLRSHFHPSERSGLSYVLLPDKDNNDEPTDNADNAVTWRTETDPQIVLDKIMERNITHFGQADGTPFTTDPLVQVLGYDGMTFQGTQLLETGILPHALQSVTPGPTRDVLNRIGDTTKKQPAITSLLSFDSFTKSIRKWRESTSTSPSGRHLGHYKSLLSIDSNSSKYTESDPDPGLDLLQILYHVAAAAFNTGTTLPRWQNITTCMIEKLPGTPRINKVRVIHLYEADYNAFNKLVWQRGIVWDAHQKGTLNKAQSGSRPARTSIEVVLSKVMKYSYSTLSRTPMATMDNDAKSCYDRTVASLALLISHHFGVPDHICKTVGITLKSMAFRIRTAMGVSQQSYCHSDSTPIYGVGQGGTASPAFWLLVSSILMDCYEQKANGMSIHDPLRKMNVKQWLEALVDDTSLFTNLSDTYDVSELVKALEHDAQYWASLLSVSGGCLELSKCFYYVLAWKFNDYGDPEPMTPHDIDAITGRVRVQICEHGKDTPMPISIKHPDTAHKTLGVWKSMTGNDSTHLTALTSRSKNMSSIVSTSGLFPYQADVAILMIYTPAMLYSLPAVNLSEKALDKIQYKALESFVPALGYNKGFSRAVMLGPSDYGGAAIPHLYTEASIQKIEYLMMHIRAKTELGTLFLITLAWIQLQAGIDEQYLAQDRSLTYIDNNWFTGISDFLHQVNGRLVIQNTYLPVLEREHDQFIMTAFLNITPKLSKKQLRHLHNWRMYFQVQVLSDITSAKGDVILDRYLKHDFITPIRPHGSTDRMTTLDWPVQSPPTLIKTFKLWQRCIRKCFLTQSGNKLSKPLGNWLRSPAESTSKWPYYYDPGNQQLYHRTNDTYQQFSSVTTSSSCTVSFMTEPSHTITTLPVTAFPVNVQIFPTLYKVTHDKVRSEVKVIQEVIATDIVTAIQQSSPWQRHILQHFRIHDLEHFTSCLENSLGKIYVGTDGGLSDGKGSFGVSISTIDSELASIEGPAPGYIELMTSFRSEGYGMMAGLQFLKLFLNTYALHIPANRKIHVYCDNLGLIKVINSMLSTDFIPPRTYLKSESDIILQIIEDIRSLETLGIVLSIEHVLGHQDDNIPYQELTREAQFNVIADTYATNYLCNGLETMYSELPANQISLYLSNNIITRKHKQEFRTSSRSPSFRTYMVKRLHWKENTPDSVWWEIHGSTIRKFHKNDQRRIRKYIFRWLPTCARLRKFDDNLVDTCPSCREHIELHDHLVRCPGSKRSHQKNKWLEDVKTFLYNERFTPTVVGQILYNQISYYCTQEEQPIVPIHDPAIQVA